MPAGMLTWLQVDAGRHISAQRAQHLQGWEAAEGGRSWLASAAHMCCLPARPPTTTACPTDGPPPGPQLYKLNSVY